MFYNLTCKKLFIFFINDTDNLKPNWIIESRFKLISKKINLYLTKLIKRNTLFLKNKRSGGALADEKNFKPYSQY